MDVDVSLPRRKTAIGLVLGLLVGGAAVTMMWHRGEVTSPSQRRVVLATGIPGGYVWLDRDSHCVWFLAGGESFPEPTGTWDDQVMHGGMEAAGILQFDADDRATFRGDVDGDHHPVKLIRGAVGGNYGCEPRPGG